MSEVAVKEYSLFTSPHFYIQGIGFLSLLIWIFWQGQPVDIEIRREAVAEAQYSFPYEGAPTYSVIPPEKKRVNPKVVQSSRGTEEKETTHAKFDINGASKAELMQIKGIGEVLATRIIAERTRLQGYTSMQQLLKVKGIGKKKLALIRSEAKVLK